MSVCMEYLRVAEWQGSHGPCSQHPLADLGDLRSLLRVAGSLVLWHHLGVWCLTVEHHNVVHQCLIPRLDHRIVLWEVITVVTPWLSQKHMVIADSVLPVTHGAWCAEREAGGASDTSTSYRSQALSPHCSECRGATCWGGVRRAG